MCLFPIKVTVRPKDKECFRQTVSCGKCLECVRQKSIEWSFRILDECSFYEKNCFITLTYNDGNLPPDEGVHRRDVQLFMKRLRKALSPLKIRFFACGEYGKKLYRPHYHFIIFNWFPDDAVYFKMDGESKLYRSKFLEKVWTFGYSSVGEVTYETALYCAKYMNKFNYDKIDKEAKHKYGADYYKLPPPFVQMSNRPGIGYNSVYSCNLRTDRIYRNGKSTKIPRYYLKVMERDGVYLDDFKEMRLKQGEIVARCTDLEDKRKRYEELFGRLIVNTD